MLVDRRERRQVTLDRSGEVLVIRLFVDDPQTRLAARAIPLFARLDEAGNPRPFGGNEQDSRREKQNDRVRAHDERILTH